MPTCNVNGCGRTKNFVGQALAQHKFTVHGVPMPAQRGTGAPGRGRGGLRGGRGRGARTANATPRAQAAPRAVTAPATQAVQTWPFEIFAISLGQGQGQSAGWAAPRVIPLGAANVPFMIATPKKVKVDFEVAVAGVAEFHVALLNLPVGTQCPSADEVVSMYRGKSSRVKLLNATGSVMFDVQHDSVVVLYVCVNIIVNTVAANATVGRVFAAVHYEVSGGSRVVAAP